jgi:hypothetical protein
MDFLFSKCRALVYLSIHKAIHIWEDTDEYGRPEYINEPICQRMIIKMVRNMPLLRWLCSDKKLYCNILRLCAITIHHTRSEVKHDRNKIGLIVCKMFTQIPICAVAQQDDN